MPNTFHFGPEPGRFLFHGQLTGSLTRGLPDATTLSEIPDFQVFTLTGLID